MPTLMETIQGNMAKAAAPQAIGATQAADQATSQAQQLGQASTGKAAAPGAQPRATNLAAQVSAGQANLGAQQLSQQAQIQGEQLKTQEAGIAQQASLQSRELDEQALSQHDTYANRAQQIMGELTRGGQQIDFNKQKAQVEQLGFNLRLANDQYVHQLDMEGQRARLDNEQVFQEQLQNAIFADDMEVLEQDIGFKEALNGKKNDWLEYLGQIDLEHAMSIANSEAKAASQQMMWTGIQTAAGAGAGAAAKYKAGQPEQETASVASPSTAPQSSRQEMTGGTPNL